MEINFELAEKSPLFDDAKTEHHSVRVTKISPACLEFCAKQYLKMLFQHKFRHGTGEYGTLLVGGEFVEYEEV